jgi:SAM-dependent methyltransferase
LHYRSRFGQLLRNWVLAFAGHRPLIGIRYLPRYIRDWIAFARASPRGTVRLRDSYPCLTDWVSATPFDAHYFYQGAWLARRLAIAKPARHVDIGSSVLTISMLSAQVETVFLDYRPLQARLSGCLSVAGDVTRLPFADGSVASLSCLHVIEHIGLGRYGDPIDPLGSQRALAELVRVLADGGQLYLSVPVGRERVCFNAHRVFSPASIVAMAQPLELVAFGFVDDNGMFHESANTAAAQTLDYGRGLFELRKNAKGAR